MKSTAAVTGQKRSQVSPTHFLFLGQGQRLEFNRVGYPKVGFLYTENGPEITETMCSIISEHPVQAPM